jgi:hypothetical protein
MNNTCKKSTANLKLTDNLTVPPETSTVYGRQALRADWIRESGSFWIEAAIDRLRAVSDRTVSVECRHMNFSSYV